MDRRVNLAALPMHEALARARVGGRGIFSDEDAVSAAYPDLLRHWTDKNMPNAVGQSDDEFNDLVSKVSDEFNAGIDEAIKAAQAESWLIPNPFEGEASAERATLIVRALQWLHDNTFVDTSPDDIEDYRTLIEIGLGVIAKESRICVRHPARLATLDSARPGDLLGNSCE